MSSRRLLPLFLVACLTTFSLRVSASGPILSATPCDAFGQAPNFASSHLLACVARKIDLPSAGPTGVVFSLSRDAGRTWSAQPAVGLPSNAASVWLDLEFSPDFATDHVIYVQERAAGLFQTDDYGATFSAADPLAIGSGSRDQMAPAWLVLPALGSVPALTYVGATDAVVSPPLHLPIGGTAQQLQGLLSRVNEERSSKAFAVSQDSATAQSYIYACSVALVCDQLLEKLPAGQVLDGMASLGARHGPVVAWVGTHAAGADGRIDIQNRLVFENGQTRRLASLDDLVNRLRVRSNSSIHVWVAPGRGPRDLVARVSVSVLEQGVPTQSLYSSSDLGSHWSLIASHRASTGAGAKRLGDPPVGSSYFRFAIYGTPDGALFALGKPTSGASALLGAIHCSRDGGRSWFITCH